MGKFEDQLWADLLTEHGDDLAAAHRPVRRHDRGRPVALTAGAFGVIGIVTALGLTLTATTSPPAYAVTENGDGSVSVAIHDIRGVAPANRELERLGVRARALPVTERCVGVPHPGPKPPPAPSSLGVRVQGTAEVTFQPNAIPAGDTLLLGAVVLPNDGMALRIGLTYGQAPDCFRLGGVPGPAAPRGSVVPTRRPTVGQSFVPATGSAVPPR